LRVGLAIYSLVVSFLFVAAALPPGQRAAGYLSVHFLLILLFFYCLRHRSVDTRELLAWGIFIRILVLFVPVFTSHDIGRYLWDGCVARHGVDPYTFAPNAVQVPCGDLPDNGDLPTLYPPLALALFTLFSSLGPLAWKFFLSALWLVAGGLRFRAESDQRSLFFWLFFPLGFLEVSFAGHVDGLVAIAFLLLDDKRPFSSGVLWGSAILAKLYPIVCLPALTRKPRTLWAGGLGTLIIGYGAAKIAGWSAWGSLGMFATRWSFGSPLGFIPREGLATAFAVTAIVLWRRGASAKSFLVAFFVCSPVVFPWYLVGLLALRPFYQTGLLLWATLLPLTYEVIDRFDRGAGWSPAVWPLGLIFMGWVFPWFYSLPSKVSIIRQSAWVSRKRWTWFDRN